METRRERGKDAGTFLEPNAKAAVQGDVSKPADLGRLYDRIRDEVWDASMLFCRCRLALRRRNRVRWAHRMSALEETVRE